MRSNFSLTDGKLRPYGWVDSRVLSWIKTGDTMNQPTSQHAITRGRYLWLVIPDSYTTPTSCRWARRHRPSRASTAPYRASLDDGPGLPQNGFLSPCARPGSSEKAEPTAPQGRIPQRRRVSTPMRMMTDSPWAWLFAGSHPAVMESTPRCRRPSRPWRFCAIGRRQTSRMPLEVGDECSIGAHCAHLSCGW